MDALHKLVGLESRTLPALPDAIALLTGSLLVVLPGIYRFRCK